MTLTFTPHHPLFVAEASPISLRDAHDEATLAEIRAGMDRFGVLVFRDQQFSDEEEMAFGQRLDGELHSKTGISALKKSRLGTEAIADVSNVGADGVINGLDDRRRLYGLGNRLWHTDASFQDPAGRYSMLHARVIPPEGGDTLFADMRAAYDALDDETKAKLEGLECHHSIAHSRQTLGFEFSEEEKEKLKGAVHPLVRTLPRAGRRSLYLASHAATIIGWPVPEARVVLRELSDHATQPQFVFRHQWRLGDLVIWDNRATMHRATSYDDLNHKRELRRVTTLDLAEFPASVAIAAE